MGEEELFNIKREPSISRSATLVCMHSSCDFLYNDIEQTFGYKYKLCRITEKCTYLCFLAGGASSLSSIMAAGVLFSFSI